MRSAVASLFCSKTLYFVLMIFLGAGVVYHILPDSCPEAAKRTMVIFVVAACFWAFEILPHYATSLLIVLSLIFMLGLPGGILGFDKLGYKVFLVPFASPVIMLFFGSFMIARALNKYNVDMYFAEKFAFKFGKHPYSILVGLMVTTMLLSMWTSNTASTAIMLGIIAPILNQLDSKDTFRKALILGVPFSANIGGIGTPIGTPPNVVAIGNLAEMDMSISFLQWMAVGVPLAIVLLGVVFLILITMFPLTEKGKRFERGELVALGNKSMVVMGIFSMVVVLWLTSKLHGIPEPLVALLGAGALVITRLLDRKDINQLDWDVLLLMWGGLALGTGMRVSGFTEWFISLPFFQQEGMVLVVIFCVIALALSTFMSNTATATLLLPLALSIPQQAPMLLAVTVAFSCSFAMALPISTPPNALAFAKGDISTRDMARAGALISVVSLTIMLLSLKFFLGSTIGI
jgi:solute carrier family 13 (sodium-dependent dicarboxylate transporter), member 2/3/5